MKSLSLMILLATGLLSGCETNVRRRQADTLALEAALSQAVNAWELVQAGRVAGVVVEFREKQGSRVFFSVRNAEQQELGMVDEHGRAWRFVPHSDEPDWLGTGTVLDGARSILGLEPASEAFEVELDVLAPVSVDTSKD